ncbi:MAG: CopG family transcriptional regulator [Stackebrandtia sp.]
MKRTTVYLPDNDAQLLKQIARRTGKSEAELIREGVTQVLHANPLRPRGLTMVVNSGDPDWAGRVDEGLADGFGADGLSS